ncbi:MAG TPA: DUF3108 domain-containing protein, partial [Candidatus Angelobacter sp.]|nr:DUF3108 domain-containing protein [Candidatus Angelobacter sp.]
PCHKDGVVSPFMVKVSIRYIAFFLTLAFASGSPGLSEQANPPSSASVSASAHIQPLRPGFEFPRQTLRYEAEYHLVTAGVATLHLEREGNQEHMIGKADSSGVVAMLFQVADTFNSYFDARSLCSNKLVKHTEEGSHRRDTLITFDYKIGKAVLEEKNLKTGQSKRTENDIPGCVTDVISGVLYVASLPLQPNATYDFPLNDGGKTVTIHAHVEGKEQIKTPAGTFQAIRVGPEGDYSALKSRGRVLMWYSDDARHLPVQVQARMWWGTLTVYLASIDK